MRLKKFYLIILVAFSTCKYSYSQNINIAIPDTICKGDTLKTLNTTTNVNSHYWSFCHKTSLLATPTSTLLQHFNNELSTSVMTKPIFDGTDYYLFITNYSSRAIIKAKYGSSYSNTPTITNLGNFSGQIPQRLEGIEIRKDGNKWFGFIVTVTNIFRLDFGTNLDNTPTLVDLGNIGGLSWPHELYIFKNNNNWYGFAANRNTSSVSRLNFGTSLQNTPTGDNISNIGITGGASGLELVQDKKNEFYLFVTEVSGNKISRVKLGSNIMNTIPTHTTINGGALTGVLRGISIIKSCDSYVGYISTENNKLIKMNFTGEPSDAITFTSVGNFSGDLKRVNDISILIKGNDSTYYLFATNTDNTIARLAFKSCINTNQTFAPSANISPQNIVYTDTGYHTINYTTNLGDANQKDTCFSIYVDKCCAAITKLRVTLLCAKTIAHYFMLNITLYPKRLYG